MKQKLPFLIPFILFANVTICQYLDTTYGNNGVLKITLENPGNTVANYWFWDDLNQSYFLSDKNFASGVAQIIKVQNTGEVDTAYGDNGFLSIEHPTVVTGSNIVFHPDGKVISIPQTSDILNEGVALYDLNGTIDSSFGDFGYLDLSSYNLQTEFVPQHTVFLSNGNIILGGKEPGNSGGNHFYYMISIKPNGTLDLSFGNNGLAYLSMGYPEMNGVPDWKRLVISEDSLIYLIAKVSGNASNVGGSYFGVFRFHLDGTLDLSFGGGDGYASIDLTIGSDIPNQLIFQENETMLILGGCYSSGFNLCSCRINWDGTLDESYGNNGMINDISYSIGSRGVIYYPELHKVISANDNIVRLNYDGSLDSTFGNDGIIEFSSFLDSEEFSAVTSLTDDTDTSFIIFGMVEENNGDYSFFSMRFILEDNLLTKVLPKDITNQIKVYPNPTTKELNVDLGVQEENIQIDIRNIHGQKVMSDKYEKAQNIQLWLDEVPGIYFMEIFNNEKKVIVRLIKTY